MKILLADDHVLIRHGLKQFLGDEMPHAQFGEAENSSQALDLIRSQSWGLVILDINMPGRDGFEVLEEVRRTKPSLPVLVLSSYGEDQMGVRALKAGAAGYVTKQSATQELIKAVKKVTDGGRYLSPDLAEQVANRLGRPLSEIPHESLSAREYHVMRMLAKGMSIKAIAGELALSPKTVTTFRRRILDKLGLQCDAEIVRYTLSHRLVE